MNGPSSKLLLPEVLQKLGNLSLRARRVAEGALTGLHRSPHHGASIEFAEHKEYTPATTFGTSTGRPTVASTSTTSSALSRRPTCRRTCWSMAAPRWSTAPTT